MSVTYDDIVNAQKIQDNVIRKTSLTFSDTFTQLTGSTVYLKNEFEQKTGSFKLRGAYYKIKTLSEEKKSKLFGRKKKLDFQKKYFQNQNFGFSKKITFSAPNDFFSSMILLFSTQLHTFHQILSKT